MIKCVCDVCGKDIYDSDIHLKVKMNKKHLTYESGVGIRPRYFYENIDLCTQCYKKICRIKADKKLDDIIYEALSDNFKKYNSPELQSAYLSAYDDITKLLIRKKILNEKIKIKD